MVKRIFRKGFRSAYGHLKRWLEEDSSEPAEVAFDNRYSWIGATFRQLVRDPVTKRRPQYVWGVLQGAALGKVLGLGRVSVIEFGVAGGAGLLALEHAAASVEASLDIGIEVYGFDVGTGLPKPQDYRDCPNIWLGEGQFPMDTHALKQRLQRASLQLGPINETIPEFLRSAPAPVAFVSFDVDLYSSTKDALELFDGEHSRLLPRVLCYFDDIMGLTYSDYNGERLAISEFNASHAMRKLSPLYGLKFFVPPAWANTWWPECFYFMHLHDHPQYNEPDELLKPMIIDVNSKLSAWKSTTDKGADLEALRIHELLALHERHFGALDLKARTRILETSRARGWTDGRRGMDRLAA